MYQTKNIKMATPWGTSDYKIEYQRGLFRINTPGHGGIAVSKGLAAKILSKEAIDIAGEVRGGYVFFEEDCAVCVAAIDSVTIMTHLSKSLNRDYDLLRAEMIQSVARWFPKYFQHVAEIK